MVVASAETIDQASQQLCGESFHPNVIPMWVYDLKSLAFLVVNQAAIDRYGYSREQFLGRTILDIRPREDIPRLLRETIQPHEHNRIVEVWTHIRKDGTSFKVEILSYELMFGGRRAELILAHPIGESDPEGNPPAER